MSEGLGDVAFAGPQGPMMKIQTFSKIKWQKVRLVISARLMLGLKVKSNSSRVFWP
jgi:hypothetical protein